MTISKNYGTAVKKNRAKGGKEFEFFINVLYRIEVKADQVICLDEKQ